MNPRRPVVEIIDPMMVEILRKKTPAERLKVAFGMWESARVMIRGVLRQQHPEWSESQILRESAWRLSHGATHRAPR